LEKRGKYNAVPQLFAPTITQLLYKANYYSITNGEYAPDNVFVRGVTSLDAKLSNLIPPIGFKLNALSSIMNLINADTRIRTATNLFDYCLKPTRICEQGFKCINSVPYFYDFERLGCYFHIVNKTSNISNFTEATDGLRKNGPLGTGIIIGYYVKKYAILKKLTGSVTYDTDIHYTIGQILAEVNMTFSDLINTQTPEFQSLVNALPGFYFVNATIGRNLMIWWNKQNGLTDVVAKVEADKKIRDDWLTRLNTDLVISLFTALRQIAGISTARGTTTNVDYWKQNLGLNSTSQFAAKSVELYPYCQVEGDPNIGCLASVALGCYGQSESICSQSYATNIFRGSYASMKYCSSYLGYQIRSSNCMTAANKDAVSRAILAYGLNMAPLSGSTTSVMNAFYPSGKCDLTKGGSGFRCLRA